MLMKKLYISSYGESDVMQKKGNYSLLAEKMPKKYFVEGSSRDCPHRGLNNHTSERDTTFLPKILRLWVYESSYL